MRAFVGAGASSPIRLGPDETDVLLRVIEQWLTDMHREDALPPGVTELRDALLDEVRDAGSQA